MYDVKTVIVAVLRAGTASNTLYHGDLIFSQGRPILVIEWSGARGVSKPSVTAQLDPTELRAASAGYGADYVYQRPVVDPRKLQ